MKHFYSLFLVAVTAAIFSITSCVEPEDDNDLCIKKTCLNGGNCQSNVCACATGYYGDSCQLLIRDKVIGNYNAVFTDGGCITTAYTIEITASTVGINYVTLKNFAGNGDDVFAIVNINSTECYLSVPNQVAGGESYEGYVRLQADAVTGTYRVERSNVFSLCEGTLTRKP